MEKIITEEGTETIQLTCEEFKEAMRENVRTVVSELGLDKVDLKHEVYPGQDNQDSLQRDAKDRQAEFWHAIIAGDAYSLKELQQRDNLSEGSSPGGGYLVPEEFQSDVLRLIPRYGLARQLCRVLPMNRDKKNIPKVTTTGVTVYWPGESNQITASQPTFGQVVLDSKKAGIIVPATTELLDDTDLLLSLLTQLAAEQFAGGEDQQLFQGTGSNPAITGLFLSGNVTKVVMATGSTSLANLGFTDIMDVENAVDPGYLEGAKWIMHRAAFKYVRKVKDDSGQYIWDRPTKEIDEYPYVKSEKCPNTVTTANKGQIALGNLKRSHVFGDRNQMTVKLLTEATVGSDKLGEQDMVAFRFIERVDIQEALPAAVVVLWTAAS